MRAGAARLALTDGYAYFMLYVAAPLITTAPSESVSVCYMRCPHWALRKYVFPPYRSA